MAGGLIRSSTALDDLEAIAEYIRRDSPFQARRVIDEAFALAESAAEQPLIGRIFPELANRSIRALPLQLSHALPHRRRGDRGSGHRARRPA